MNNNASLFAQQRDEIFAVPLAPQGPTVVATTAFNHATKPGALDMAANLSASVAPPKGTEQLANDAEGVGQTLRDPPTGIYLPQTKNQSAFGELGGQAAKLGAEVGMAAYNMVGDLMGKKGFGILGILSDEHAGNDKNANGIPDEMEMKVAAAPPPMQNAAPSPSSGPGGMG